jgi:hypothetical protein
MLFVICSRCQCYSPIGGSGNGHCRWSLGFELNISTVVARLSLYLNRWWSLLISYCDISHLNSVVEPVIRRYRYSILTIIIAITLHCKWLIPLILSKLWLLWAKLITLALQENFYQKETVLCSPPKRKTLLRLLSYLKPYWWALLLTVVGLLY